MKKTLKIIPVMLVLLILSACQVHMNLWVKNNGSGNGTITLIDVPMAQTEAQKQSLEEKGFEIISIEAEEANKVIYKVKWEDFGKPFESRTKNSDGTVTLDFGLLGVMGEGSLTVHVPGKIIKTTGEVKKNNTVVFKSGKASVTYKPGISGAVIFVLLLVLVIGIPAFVVLFVMKKKKQENSE